MTPGVSRLRSQLSRLQDPGSGAAVVSALRNPEQPRSVADLVSDAWQVQAELVGLGPLQQLAAQDGVTDILVNGTSGVWTDSGAGLRRRSVGFDDEAQVRALAVRLAALGGRRLDEATPWVDAQLPGGVRLHAIIPPLAADGTCLSLRIPGRVWTLRALVAAGAMSPDWSLLLESVVRARVRFLISGATGTGKTAVLAAMLGCCPSSERVVVVEDTVELAPTAAHVVRVQARHANSEGAGRVEMAELVRQALRMRPDRLVVGECRGKEVLDLLAALNTGHCGCGTVHAGGPAEVPTRLEALGLLAGVPRPAMQAQVAAGLDVLVHLSRDGRGRRRVESVAVVQPAGDRDAVRVITALDVHSGAGPGWSALADRLGWVGPPPERS
ncbi:MAG: TadA family conjugal transfer-associated ATPase [Actinomycetales bacterium]